MGNNREIIVTDENQKNEDKNGLDDLLNADSLLGKGIGIGKGKVALQERARREIAKGITESKRDNKDLL